MPKKAFKLPAKPRRSRGSTYGDFLSQQDMADFKRLAANRNSMVKRGELPKHDEDAIQMPKPLPKSDDAEKIVRLGFDPKTSFRRRKSK